MRITEKLANRIILIAVSFIILLFLLLSNSSKFLLYAFSNESQYNLDYIKDEYDKNIFQKNNIINMFGWLADSLGVKEMNDVVKFEKIAYHKDSSISEIDRKVDSITRIKDIAGGKLAYVQLPSPIMSDNEIFERYYHTNTYNDMQEYLSKLREKDIAVFDLSQYNNHKPLEYRYFRTDHHWRPEFMFEFIRPVIEIVQNFYPDIYVDDFYTDINNYNIEIYKDFMFGSAGKRVGPKFLQPEDFSVIFPKFKTSLEVEEVLADTPSVKGDFEYLFIHRNLLKKDYFNANVYQVYINDYIEYLHCKNLMPQVNKSLFLFVDSYAYPLSMFLCNIFEDVYIIDVRDTDKSFVDVITQENPDLVMFLYTHFALDDPNIFDIR